MKPNVNRLKVTKTRITQSVLTQLAGLGLSIVDLDIILCFGRRIEQENITLFIFDPDFAPVDSNKLNYLQGITIRVFEGKIVSIDRAHSTGLDNSLKNESCK